MKNRIFFQVVLLATCFSLQGQSIKEIDFDYDEISKLTTSAFTFEFTLINDYESLIVIGQSKIAKINNRTGKILKTFDDSILTLKFDSIICRNYEGCYSILSDSLHLEVNTCTRQPYVYQRFYRINNTRLYSCEIWSVVRNLINSDELTVLQGIGFFNEDLDLVDFIEREGNENSLLGSGEGGWFNSKYEFYIKKVVPNESDEFDFVHFQLIDGKFIRIGELEVLKCFAGQNLWTGRFYSMFKIDDYYYIFNEISFIKTKSLNEKGKLIDYHLKSNELIGTLKYVGNNKVVGFRLILHEDGIARKAILFTSDIYFNKVKEISKFNLVDYSIGSLDVLNQKVYISFFDRRKEKYLLQVIEL